MSYRIFYCPWYLFDFNLHVYLRPFPFFCTEFAFFQQQVKIAGKPSLPTTFFFVGKTSCVENHSVLSCFLESFWRIRWIAGIAWKNYEGNVINRRGMKILSVALFCPPSEYESVFDIKSLSAFTHTFHPPFHKSHPPWKSWGVKDARNIFTISTLSPIINSDFLNFLNLSRIQEKLYLNIPISEMPNITN